MIKTGLFTALCLCIGLAVTVPYAWADALNDVVKTLETPFQAETAAEHRIFDYAADFSQESKIASLDRLQRASGRVEVAFADQAGRAQKTGPTVKFHWQYDSPTTQKIVSDGQTMWVYLPENNQVIESNLELASKTDQGDPMAFLTGLGNLSRDFSISWAMPQRDAAGNYVLQMTPRQPSTLIGKLVIVVDRHAVESFRNRDQAEQPLFPIQSTTVYDTGGNSTLIQFSNLRINRGILDSAFDFIVPEGVQVIRPTGEQTGF